MAKHTCQYERCAEEAVFRLLDPEHTEGIEDCPLYLCTKHFVAIRAERPHCGTIYGSLDQLGPPSADDVNGA